MTNYRVAAEWYPDYVQHAISYYFDMRIPESFSPWVYAPKVLTALLSVDGRPQGRSARIVYIASRT